MKKNIFVALDFSNFDKALDIAEQVKNDAAGLKITNELFAICGKEGLKKLAGFGLEIFLDLKIHDVPNTVKKTVASISLLKTVKYLTVHTSGGAEMLREAKETSGTLELLGVTVLTSQSASKEQVKVLADLGVKSGLHGIIASAQEYLSVRSLSKNLKIFCPGIRGLEDKIHDQKRVMSYSEFCKISKNDDKAFAVIGRPIYESGDASQNIKKIIQSVK
ncbi:MAG: orotidine-5'-phosphate decarboxylase [Candidatus Pelagibacter sp. TMED196]|nr:MAG: orotidine-5'-phosphate decarboxylase [Candidatus Pelagibacter sp. TMED196]